MTEEENEDDDDADYAVDEDDNEPDYSLTAKEEEEFNREFYAEGADEDQDEEEEEGKEKEKEAAEETDEDETENFQTPTPSLAGDRTYLLEYFKKIKTMPVTGVVYPGQRRPEDIQKLVKSEFDDDPLSSFTADDTEALRDGVLPRVPVLLDRHNQDWNSIHTPLMQRVLHLWRLIAVKDFLWYEKKRAMQDGSRTYFDLFQFLSLPMPGQDWKKVGTEEIKLITHHLLKYSSLKGKYRLMKLSDITDDHVKQLFPHLFITVSPQHHKQFWSEENNEWMKIMFKEAFMVINDNAHLYRFDQKMKQLIDIHSYLFRFYQDYCESVADDYAFDQQKKAENERKRLELAKAGASSSIAKAAAEQQKKQNKERLTVKDSYKQNVLKQRKLTEGETNMSGEEVLPVKK